MEVTFDVKGLRELDRQLDKLSARGAKAAKRAALRKGAQALRKEIKPKLPRTAGKGKNHLRNRIGISERRNGDVDVGYTGAARKYGHIIEYDTTIDSTGTGVWTRAFESEAARVIDITGTALGEAIINQIRRGN